MNNSNTRALTIDELDLVAGGKISESYIGGLFFTHNSITNTTSVGTGDTGVVTRPDAVVIIRPGGNVIIH